MNEKEALGHLERLGVFVEGLVHAAACEPEGEALDTAEGLARGASADTCLRVLERFPNAFFHVEVEAEGVLVFDSRGPRTLTVHPEGAATERLEPGKVRVRVDRWSVDTVFAVVVEDDVYVVDLLGERGAALRRRLEDPLPLVGAVLDALAADAPLCRALATELQSHRTIERAGAVALAARYAHIGDASAAVQEILRGGVPIAMAPAWAWMQRMRPEHRSAVVQAMETSAARILRTFEALDERDPDDPLDDDVRAFARAAFARERIDALQWFLRVVPNQVPTLDSVLADGDALAEALVTVLPRGGDGDEAEVLARASAGPGRRWWHRVVAQERG
jgi:hypothetical protein